ncbi:MAG: hypothetical protein MR842_12955 [Clostridiales bacterium]|nr:hypothetical protein [Clostridiales bacterium]MDO4349544.1 hypothetical protein [Eubacteriales bacterium]MDY4007255.1 hypothetical protein [Candidatus Limiplasma sp.]
MSLKRPSPRQTAWHSRAHRAWYRLCAVCLSLYIGYATYLSQSAFLQGRVETAACGLGFLLVSGGVWLALTQGCERWFANAAPRPCAQRARLDARVYLIALGICLAVFGCAFAACWPGGVSYDASNQWRQAHSGEFNNWHPLFHTLLIWLVTRVCDSYPFAVFVQIAAFSAAMAYLTATLNKRGVPAWLALGAHALVAASLPVRNTLMYLGKDSAMTIGVMALTAQAVNILYTRGEWLRKPLNAMAFGAALAFASLVRHNAFFWTVPLLLSVLFAFGGARRFAALAAGVMAGILALVQGPLYGALDVVYPSNLVEESVGVPMTVLADVKQQAPELLDEETNAFLESLASDGAWRDTYAPHNYNSIKFTYDREKIAFTPLSKLLGMTARTALRAPRIAFEAVNGLTGLVWDVTGENRGWESVRNSGDLEEARYGRATLNKIGGKLCAAIDAVMCWLPIRWITQNIGVQQLLLLMVALWALYRHGVPALALALPVLVYNLGTMALLCGNDARFFQCAMTVSVPCALALLYLPPSKEA